MHGKTELKVALNIAKGGAEGRLRGTTVCVYGHGPTKNPFYTEAQTVKAHSEGCLLLLCAQVSCGQRLLLMNGSGQNPVAADVVTTRNLTAQISEVEVAFAAPRPDFWRPLLKQ